jgi:hypothetical protein
VSFRDRPRQGARRRIRPELVIGAGIVLFLALALAKPWGETGVPGASAARPTPLGSPVSDRPGAQASGPGSAIPPTPDVALTLLDLGLPLPDASARSIDQWGSLDWVRLPRGGAAPYLTSVLAWKRGFVALGWLPNAAETSVWTSSDGSHWDDLPFATATTFWPRSTIVGLAEVPGGLVAVTVLDTGCTGGAPCAQGGPPIVGWISADGVSWSPDGLPDLGPAEALAGVVVATSPDGIVAVSAGRSVASATTHDGVTWTSEPASGMGPSTILADAVGTDFGYLVAGATGEGADATPTVWLSPDGVRWTPSTLAGLPGTDGGRTGSIASSLAAGSDGVIAHVLGATSVPDTWWQTSDGRTWQALPTAPRKGPWLFALDGRVIGDLLAGDGSRIVAVRGGAFPVAWVSSDGRAWRQIPVRGELPSDTAQRAILVPGGMLVTDGETAWLGVAGAG